MLQVVVLLTQPVKKFTNNGTLITSWDSTGLEDSEFVFNLENLPKWASAAFQSIKEQDGEWIVGTPQGSQSITQRNGFGSFTRRSVRLIPQKFRLYLHPLNDV